MSYFKSIWIALKSIFRTNRVEDDLDKEVAFHLDMQTKHNVENGMSLEVARKQAIKSFGGGEKFKEDCRDSWGTRLFMDTLADIKFTLRQLRRSKGFPTVTLLTIAICGGLNVAVFSYVHAWIVKPFDYPNEEEVVAIGKVWRNQRNKVGSISPLSFVEIQKGAQSFKAIGFIDSDDSVDVSIEGGAAFVTDIMLVSPGVWEVS